MILKKNPKYDLEKKRSYFLQIGLVLSLLFVIIAFEWKTYDKNLSSLGSLELLDLEEEIIPLTEKELKPPPPPPPPPPLLARPEPNPTKKTGDVSPRRAPSLPRPRSRALPARRSRRPVCAVRFPASRGARRFNARLDRASARSRSRTASLRRTRDPRGV